MGGFSRRTSHRYGARVTDQPHNHGIIADKVNSTVSKVLSSWVWPTVMAILGFLIVDKLRGIEAGQVDARARAEMAAADISAVSSRVALLDARLDDRVIRQVDANATQIKELDQRVRVIERVVKTP